MIYETIFELGDWSNDGHNQSDKYKIKSNKPVEDLRELHFKFCEQHFEIGNMCNEYQEYNLSAEVKAKLDNINVSYKDFEDEANTKQLLIIWLDCLKHIDSTFEYFIIEEDTPIMHFDTKGRHLVVPGYGLFD